MLVTKFDGRNFEMLVADLRSLLPIYYIEKVTKITKNKHRYNDSVTNK